MKTITVVNVQTGIVETRPMTPDEELATIPAPKTPAEIEAEASNEAKAKLAKLRADIFPDVLTFLATLPGVPAPIVSAAGVAAAEKVKIK